MICFLQNFDLELGRLHLLTVLHFLFRLLTFSWLERVKAILQWVDNFIMMDPLLYYSWIVMIFFNQSTYLFMKHPFFEGCPSMIVFIYVNFSYNVEVYRIAQMNASVSKSSWLISWTSMDAAVKISHLFQHFQMGVSFRVWRLLIKWNLKWQTSNVQKHWLIDQFTSSIVRNHD